MIVQTVGFKVFSSILVLTSITLVQNVYSSRVLEMNDRFLEVKDEGNWFIMFYAPWCGHCKRLEPIWLLVAQALHNTDIRVGRIDCTRYKGVVSEFGLRAYPTILFIKGNEGRYNFDGERSTEELVHFAKRMVRPPVQEVTDSSDIEMLKQSQKHFFMFIGDSKGHFWDLYYDLAKQFQPHSYFYITSENKGKQHFLFGEAPTVVVFKEDQHYPFNAKEWDMDVNASLTRWVNTERFNTFVKVTRSNIHQVFETNKYLVLAIVEESKRPRVPLDHSQFLKMVESVIVQNRDRFHRDFQFGWIGSPEFANAITLSEVPVPSLIIFNSTTRHHHFPDEQPYELTPESITIFLEAVRNQSVKTYGGSGFFIQVYRMYYETKTSLVNIWTGNPAVACVLFGLPMIFLLLIIYSTCCTDIMDASEEDEDDDENHEKKD
ncbi:protein disulfide-isomerase TMX3 [Adelges cooleyi]|uniref:protein disulfide-isomerase TMX3 n=1 Tax=Adelges cooleyi TaxID=133065 RepID=UPI0021809A80|nr:protein disulfide-isomerase TMX3 [Adelges cooleyi]